MKGTSLHIATIKLFGLSFLYLLGGEATFAATTLSSSACQQFGGPVQCVVPDYLPGPWVYTNNRGSAEIKGSTPEEYLSKVQAATLSGQGGNQFCSLSMSVTQCTVPVAGSSGSLSQTCGYSMTYSLKLTGGQCLPTKTAISLDGIYGYTGNAIPSCPSGYDQTVGTAYIYPRYYPFLCALTPVIQPDDDAGDPNSPDTSSPSPDTTPPPKPDPVPKAPAPGEGGGGGSGSSDPCNGIVGDPINTANGNKFITITDYAPANSSPLRLVRYYDSKMAVDGTFGSHWRHDYERRIETVSATVVKVRRADGKASKFTLINGQWAADGRVNLRLQSLGSGQGWRVVGPRDEVELYDAQGRLIQLISRGGLSQTLVYDGTGKLATVTDSFGRQLRLQYDAQGRVVLVTDPAGKLYRYTYDAAGNLSSRTAPDNRSLSYLYQNPALPHALTGVVDGNGVQIDTTFYDAKGRAYGNERNASIDKVEINYLDNGAATVTDTNNTAQSYTFQLIQGVMKATGMTRSCPTCGTVTRTFDRDANGNIASRTDYNGIQTTFQYDLARNLQTSRTEAVGTPQERTVATEWHPVLNVPTRITEPGRRTEMEYDDNGNMTALSVTDTATGEKRIWTYGYGAHGLLASRTLPGGEGVSYEYDNNGLITTATTTGGLVTQYLDYDANGHMGKVLYPGGRAVVFTYDEAGRVLTRAETVQSASDGTGWWRQVMDWLRKLLGLSTSDPQAQGESGTAVTRYTYDGAGLLTDIALPDGETLHYEYDAAYRLILARDAWGNTVRIIRDPYGKPLDTQVTDGAGALALTLQRTYDELGRVAKVLGNNGQQLIHRYDEEGYLLEQVNILGNRTARGRDALYRTTSVTDADNRNTTFEFDPLDHLTEVTDARGNRTSYGRNAFGETVTERSPDRGNLLREFENARLKRSTDTRGITHEFAYDADGRLVSRISPNSRVSYRYDEGEFGQGRLTGIEDGSGSTRYRYDSRGRVVEKSSVIEQGPTLKMSYGYTLGGKLKEIATPGKHLVQYGYDAQGRLSSVSVDGQVLLSQVRLSAQGVTGWTWSDGSRRDEIYDQDGRIIQITSGGALARVYGYDATNRLTSLLDSKAGVNDRYGYDAVGRLVSQLGGAFSVSYRYDSLGNRTQMQRSGQSASVTTRYDYDPASNRLLSETTNGTARNYAYLPSGQLSGNGAATYSYNDDGRLIDVGGQRPLHNDYNALGQRVRKVGQGVLVFAYDEAGHLLGEYTPGGVMVREYIWLGNRLVGMLSQQGKHVLYVHTDHLGTPRAVSDGSTVLWRWEGEAFGSSQPNEQVAGPSRKFNLPLRFPGQYYDSETGFFYNYFRDYNSQIGRYIESDPVGLQAGVNTFTYVYNSPAHLIDPLGLRVCVVSCDVGEGAEQAGEFVGGSVGDWLESTGQAVQDALTLSDFGGEQMNVEITPYYDSDSSSGGINLSIKFPSPESDAGSRPTPEPKAPPCP